MTNLENALNNGNFKEQVYSSLEGVYQISKVLNQLDLLKNFSDHDLEINSFYQNKTANLRDGNKIVSTYRTTCIFETPSEQADYKIAVFARKHKDLWVNMNYTANTSGFETSFLNNANFRGLTTQSIPTTYTTTGYFTSIPKRSFMKL
ncbi:hypothetical protein [Helicobacter phage KHP30]|uniref:Uncharacterized protein n=1 Tax=Helicobacter pylori bacteriophage KHP30 TaxID=1208236 RepID=I7HHN6_BPKHP|nr:hypothetical protein G181_gp22 [Helicobacter phage KHP30]BAM34764.1 hypothetical protein [Helicobacter phage KHP30]